MNVRKLRLRVSGRHLFSRDNATPNFLDVDDSACIATEAAIVRQHAFVGYQNSRQVSGMS
jgi:hypothetical protein